MRSRVEAAFAELYNFLAKYNLANLSNNKHLQSDLKHVFKRFFAIIVWNEAVTISIWKGKKAKNDQFRLYFGEMTSDVCLSIFISYQGMYKPAMIVLRSALENFFRCVAIGHDKKIGGKSVRQLIQLVRETDLKNDPVALQCLDRLIVDYVALCEHVHTSDQDHMSLTSVVGEFPRYVGVGSKDASKQIANVCANMCSINCIFLPAVFRSMHHSHKDVIYDILAKKVRQHLAAAGSG